ncbi:conserved phage C-terminal domain-containing protein [Ligilactobacillus salivarius]|uniref:conserved phage C-terminal domain-containing protein n=1 Tax=Ligilactobacillus salivarius TaxID=1624 RepID=UPI003D00F216
MRIKKQYQKGFTTVDNLVLNDTKLSWKAKGLFVYLWSQSDEWDFYETEVVKHSTDKIASLKSGLKELEQQGYLKRQRKRDDKGHLKENEWILSDNPMLENPMLDNHMLENHTLTNTNNNNINNNKDESNSSEKNKDKKSSNKKSKYNLNYTEFIEWFNKETERDFKPENENTIELFRKKIEGRFKKGYTKQDIYLVTKDKAKEWKNSKKMKPRLQPSTLFGEAHFEEYLTLAKERYSPEPQKKKEKSSAKREKRKDPIEEKIYQYQLFLQEHPDNEDVRKELEQLERNRTENSGNVA